MFGTCDAGDVVIYDSSIIHFGTANSKGEERHAVNLNYRRDESSGLGFEDPSQWEGWSESKMDKHFNNMLNVRAAYAEMAWEP